MWPFKRNPKEPAKENWWEAPIRELQAWRPIGGSFQYLGRECVVSAHFRHDFGMGGFALYDIYRPGIRADYADDNGVIHNLVFSLEESRALMEANP